MSAPRYIRFKLYPASELQAAYMAGHYAWPTTKVPTLEQKCLDYVASRQFQSITVDMPIDSLTVETSQSCDQDH